MFSRFLPVCGTGRRNREITISLSAITKTKKSGGIVSSVVNTSASAGLVFPLSAACPDEREKGEKKILKILLILSK
jgi:hypothetical protein